MHSPNGFITMSYCKIWCTNGWLLHAHLKYLGHTHRVYGYDGSFEYIVDSRQEVLVVFNGGTAHFLLRHKELSLYIVRCPMKLEPLSNGLSCP